MDTDLLKKQYMGYIKYVVISFIIAILLLAYWPFHSVPTGSRGVVTTFGKITGIEQEGLVILPPWKRLTVFSVRAETASVEKATGSTHDTQPVDTSLTVRYSIKPDMVASVYEQYSHDGDLSSYVETATQEVFKAVTADYTAPELIAKRTQVSFDIRDKLQKKLDIYGARVINIDMRSFEFNRDYMTAISDKVTQEQKRLAAENAALTVQAQQKSEVFKAEGAASAVRAKADGDAYAVVKAAEAQAEAMAAQGKALAANPQVLELQRIQVEQTKAEQWNGQLPQNVYAGAPIPFLNASK